MAHVVEDARQVLVALDVLLRDVAGLANRRRLELVATGADKHGPILPLVDVDPLARRRARHERVLDEVKRTPVVDREVGRQPALLLPREDLLEIVLGTERSVGVVWVGRLVCEARVVGVEPVVMGRAESAPSTPSPPPNPPPPTQRVPPSPSGPKKPVWYGWQTLLVDGASVLALLGGITAPVGMVGYFVGGPIVHFAHGHVGKGLGDLGLRVGAPLLGGLGAVAILESGNGPPGGDSPAGPIVFIFLGVLAGAGVASIVDAAALGWEEVPVKPVQAVRVVPIVSMIHEQNGGTRTSVGFSGGF
jgi:hypothetical protein